VGCSSPFLGSLNPHVDKPLKSVTHCQYDARPTVTFPAIGIIAFDRYQFILGKVKASHTRYRALGPEMIPVYRQSACR